MTALSNGMIGVAFTFYGNGALMGSLSGGLFSDKLGNDRVIKMGIIGLGIFILLVRCT
ncbi:TPA: hypothetical protein R1940_001504 [Staphylococcus delphini]|nr:hypothetical protein [Staphylococcus delphini]HEC2190420.1 hypothetical protein [Staphylococcus delphini]HEC2216907.1 hypothetical protein [Staphylococcus delphini]HEC2230751.1 hypothetical protein [Staphylococcus delphini]